MISVALIEDNRVVREGLSTLLNQLPDARVVAGAASADTSMLRATNESVRLTPRERVVINFIAAG